MTNQDGGAGGCPAPCVRLTLFCHGSGRAGGQGLEWIDRWFADEEAEDLAEFVWFQSHHSQVLSGFLFCS